MISSMVWAEATVADSIAMMLAEVAMSVVNFIGNSLIQ
jgi:hypothetical protein